MIGNNWAAAAEDADERLIEQVQQRPLIAVVGPCAAGKSLLVQALREQGYNAREVGQEHSYVPTMWQRITAPDVLIYLDVSWVVAQQRRPSSVPSHYWDKLVYRLRHARRYADLYLDTDSLAAKQVLARVLEFLPFTLAAF